MSSFYVSLLCQPVSAIPIRSIVGGASRTLSESIELLKIPGRRSRAKGVIGISALRVLNGRATAHLIPRRSQAKTSQRFIQFPPRIRIRGRSLFQAIPAAHELPQILGTPPQFVQQLLVGILLLIPQVLQHQIRGPIRILNLLPLFE
jgi:hypothetical protein